MKINELEQLNTAQQIFESFSKNTDTETAQYMRTMHENFTLPFIAHIQSKSILTEAQLSAQQITDIFQQAEQGMAGLGANRSLLGKGADIASAAGQDLAAAGKGAVNMAQKGAQSIKDLAARVLNPQQKQQFVQNLPPADAGPVDNFEQQAAQAAEQIQDPKAKQSVMDLVKQGVKNPVTQTLILTAVGSIAAVVAGPAIAGLGLGAAATGALTGAVVGGLTKLTQAKMQGKDWKTAGKEALKGAGMGAAVGGIGGAVVQGAQAIGNAWQQSHQPQQGSDIKLPAADQAENQAALSKAAEEWATANPAERARIEQVTGMTPQQLQANIPDPDMGKFDAGQGQGWDNQNTQQSQNHFRNPAFAQADQQRELMNKFADSMGLPPGNHQARFQGGVPVEIDGQVVPSVAYTPQQRMAVQAAQSLSQGVREYIDRRQTARTWVLRESLGRERGGVVLTEAGIDAVFEGLGDYFKNMGKNLTNKVTVDKLKSAWQKAGMPNDSEQIAQLLTKAGVGQAVVGDIFTGMGVPYSGAPQQPQNKQGILGRAAGAVGGAIGGVKGAIAGTKDAFAGGKASGFDKARAGQAGDALGASDASNPYAKSTNSTQAAGANTTAASAGAGGSTTAGAGASAGGGQVAQTGSPFLSGLAKGLGADAVANDIEANARAGGGIRGRSSLSAPLQQTTTEPVQEPTAAETPPAVWKNNRNPEAPASTTPDFSQMLQPTTPAEEPAAASQPQANPFGQMAGQLKTYAPPETTSTGGTLTQTPTGQVHKANPNNPNAQTTPAAAAEPQGQALDLDQLKAQRAAKQAQGQADQQKAMAQMKATADANAASATKKSEPAVPGFMQSKLQGRTTAQPQWTGREPAKAMAESRVDFGAMLFNRMKSGK